MRGRGQEWGEWVVEPKSSLSVSLHCCMCVLLVMVNRSCCKQTIMIQKLGVANFCLQNCGWVEHWAKRAEEGGGVLNFCPPPRGPFCSSSSAKFQSSPFFIPHIFTFRLVSFPIPPLLYINYTLSCSLDVEMQRLDVTGAYGAADNLERLNFEGCDFVQPCAYRCLATPRLPPLGLLPLLCCSTYAVVFLDVERTRQAPWLA
jgi:hypothetical protein